MLRRTATMLGTAAAAFLLTTTAALAADDELISAGEDNVKYRRSCDTVYFGAVGTTYALTRKDKGGTCKGHAWVRAYTYSGWTSWQNGSTDVEISSSGGHITRAQHKGCADCQVHSTELRWLD
ncbi:hypothetical protein ACFQ60_38640 [Streptomyces zhihengii]|uniref:Uncharacterized protein n=1 Tax=Streptomyces zhihengii TaxID=1818004 RepID=A0ABS2ULH4_9ACTN|nr:hypothetical protein [Streptomyces zhihengii]MBM9618381.1 hypothetical protein [Streptomyces zhihengii]